MQSAYEADQKEIMSSLSQAINLSYSCQCLGCCLLRVELKPEHCLLPGWRLNHLNRMQKAMEHHR